MAKVYTFAWHTFHDNVRSEEQEFESTFYSLKAAKLKLHEHIVDCLDVELALATVHGRNVDYAISKEGGLHVKVGDRFLRRYRMIERFV